jgi:hypothetical protein
MAKHPYYDDLGIPYPPVFRDWHPDRDLRVATGLRPAGPIIEMFQGETAPGGGSIWHGVELDEEDTLLLAASLVQRVGKSKLAARIVKAAQQLAAEPADKP